MPRPRALPLLLLVGLLKAASASQHVMMLDCSGRHLSGGGRGSAGSEDDDLMLMHGPRAAAGLTAAVGGLTPPHMLDRNTAQEISPLIKSSVFDRPQAMVLLNLAGVPRGDATLDTLMAALPGGTWLRARVAGGAGETPPPATADDMVRWQAELAAANPDVAFEALDDAEACDVDCYSAALRGAAEQIGASLVEAGQPEQGDAGTAPAASAALRLPGGGEVQLGSGAGRLFGAELAALHGAGRAKVTNRAARRAGEGEGEDLAVFHATLVGLQALRAEEQALAAAAEALGGVLRHLAGELEAEYGDDVVYQVTLLGDAPAGGEGSQESSQRDPQDALAAWKRTVRRSMLEAPLMARRRLAEDMTLPLTQNGTTADAKAFAAKATSYGVTLLLIYATAAILYAMVNMPFKQDTLLYGRPKGE
ncbi:MAG: hypothetical protein J3K34DRAFT_32039 [Monoraphidium minutum]|nr:MAG: hypothetical protein J3K34DRAFT_32039 [Monoraphidium minutum]